MSGDDHVDIGARIDVQLLQVVQNVDRLFREAYQLGVGVFAGPLTGVYVSSDRGDGRDPAKRVDDVGLPDVAGVNDVIDAGQATLRLRPQQAVRVRNDSDPEHHLLAWSTAAIARRRSRSSTRAESIFHRAVSISYHSARSTSGKFCHRPLRSGHLISKELLASIAGWKLPSPANAITRFPALSYFP